MKMKLSQAPEGAIVQVVEVHDGEKGIWRAVSLGLAPGTILEVVVNKRGLLGYPVLVRKAGRAIAVSRTLAEKVEVVLVEEGVDNER